ncbi:DsrE/DsrF/TusD sulfur relay family protein [Glaciecola sp. 1036]|uniref:DsrE/DsrF/TusD sulfur relay family protein n=1 Tax=Alteromonadaceae TaxID=72275 RepID=UPI003CFFF9E1
MTTFALFITQSPTQANATHALRFCRATYASGNKVAQVFFYGDGTLLTLDADGDNTELARIQQQWLALAQEHGFKLCVCPTAGEKRGLCDQEGNARFNYAQGFFPTGMMDYFATLKSPEVIGVQF